MTIETFSALLAEKDGLGAVYQEQVIPLQAELDAAIKAAYLATNPPRKTRDLAKMRAALGNDRVSEITAPFRERADVLYKTGVSEREREIEDKLVALAPSLEIPRTPELELRYTIYSSTYSSQGSGMHKYGRQTAQQAAEAAIRHGLVAEVRGINERTVRGYYGGDETYRDYGVFANTTEVGWQIVRRLPDQTMREYLADCWKKGINPRVLNPFLPHGLEERLGVSFFGELVEPVKGA